MILILVTFSYPFSYIMTLNNPKADKWRNQKQRVGLDPVNIWTSFTVAIFKRRLEELNMI